MIVCLKEDDKGPFFEILNGKDRMIVRPLAFARKAIGLKSDLLAKAIGYKKGLTLSVVDATAGLCRDADHLARLGCQVVAIEQNEVLYRGLSHSPKNFELKLGEACEYLSNLNEEQRPDVVYLDPMFPESKKSAKPGKETVLLQLLCAPPSAQEEQNLLQCARRVARKRVVVKRARLAPPLSSREKPQLQILGKAVRFDVYFSSSYAPNSSAEAEALSVKAK